MNTPQWGMGIALLLLVLGGCIDDETEVRQRTRMFAPGARNVGITIINDDLESDMRVHFWSLPTPVSPDGGRALWEFVDIEAGDEVVIQVAFRQRVDKPEIEEIEVWGKGVALVSIAAINPRLVISEIAYWAQVNAI